MGEKVCDGSGYRECENSTGNLEWSEIKSCGTSKECRGNGICDFDECSSGDKKCGSDNKSLQICEKNSNGFWKYSTATACDSDGYDICKNGVCIDCGNPTLIPSLKISSNTPLLNADTTRFVESGNFMYSPDVIKVTDNLTFMYYSAKDLTGTSHIFLAISSANPGKNGYYFDRYPDKYGAEPIIEGDFLTSYSDPSVVIDKNELWHLYYTGGEIGNRKIYHSTSNNGIVWTQPTLVLDKGTSGSLDEKEVFAPSIVYFKDTSTFYMIYSEQNNAGKFNIALAQSSTGNEFTTILNPYFSDASNVDVEFINNDTLFMFRPSADGVYYATSSNGINWCDKGLLFSKGTSGSNFEYGIDTPTIFLNKNKTFIQYFLQEYLQQEN